MLTHLKLGRIPIEASTKEVSYMNDMHGSSLEILHKFTRQREKMDTLWLATNQITKDKSLLKNEDRLENNNGFFWTEKLPIYCRMESLFNSTWGLFHKGSTRRFTCTFHMLKH